MNFICTNWQFNSIRVFSVDLRGPMGRGFLRQIEALGPEPSHEHMSQLAWNLVVDNLRKEDAKREGPMPAGSFVVLGLEMRPHSAEALITCHHPFFPRSVPGQPIEVHLIENPCHQADFIMPEWAKARPTIKMQEVAEQTPMVVGTAASSHCGAIHALGGHKSIKPGGASADLVARVRAKMEAKKGNT